MAVATAEKRPPAARTRTGLLRWLGRLARAMALLVLGYFVACTILLILYRFVHPPITTVQVQRWVESWGADEPYTFRYQPVDAEAMALVVRQAAVASEDARFYTHGGIDWIEIERAREDARQRGTAPRGASTITQQLVKNLFLTTHRSYLRKGLEVPLTYLAELILPKERILTLYLNVVEWGPGVYGIDEAAATHYSTSARALSRDQAARLVACLPAPRDRRPQEMSRTASRIQTRMRQMGW